MEEFQNFIEDGKIVGAADEWNVYLCENGSITDLLNRLHNKNITLNIRCNNLQHLLNKSKMSLNAKISLCNAIDQMNDELIYENDQLRTDNKQLKDDVKVVLLILQAIGELPFKISVSEAKAIKRLSENVGELFDD